MTTPQVDLPQEPSHNPFMELRWQHVGPAHTVASGAPPRAARIDDYVLAYDEIRRSTIYLCASGHDEVGPAFAFDGSAWVPVCDETVAVDAARQCLTGGYDPSRGGVVAWSFTERGGPCAVVLATGGPVALEMTGDLPIADEDLQGDQARAVFAHDHVRGVTVCLTSAGVWEMDAVNVWRRVASAGGLIPNGWQADSFGGGFDAPRNRVVFWLVADGELVFLGWDGETLVPVSTEGLPTEVVRSHRSAPVCEHPDQGVILFAGPDHGIFALGDGWLPLPMAVDPPPRSGRTRMCYDRNLDAVIIGPGAYRAGAESVEQMVFHVMSGGRWRHDNVEAVSPLAPLGPKPRLAAAGGHWYAVASTRLQTYVWSDERWRELIDRQQGVELFNGGVDDDRTFEIAGLAADGDRLFAVANAGEVFELEGDTWVERCGPVEEFRHRVGSNVVFEPYRQRIVVWGGEVDGRRSHRTLAWEEGAWRVIGAGAAAPRDFEGHRPVGFDLVYDSTLGALVRFGRTEVALLIDDEWVMVDVPGYRDVASERWRAPVHDEFTGETLILNFTSGEIARFDLGGCEVIASLRRSEGSDEWWQELAGTWAYDAEARRLQSIGGAEPYVLDLTPAFVAAAKRRARAVALPAPESTRHGLYRVDEGGSEFWLGTVAGSLLRVRTGVVGSDGIEKDEELESAEVARTWLEHLIEQKRSEGFVRAEELSTPALQILGGRPSRTVTIGNRQPDETRAHDSRIGGQPAVGSLNRWPAGHGEQLHMLADQLPLELPWAEVSEESRRELTDGLGPGRAPEPYGFLLQIATGELLRDHAGVAVFCHRDATRHQVFNHVELISRRAWGQPAPIDVPDAAPVLPMIPLALGQARWEIDEHLTASLIDLDPELATPFGDLPAEARVGHHSKVGGAPAFLQQTEVLVSREQRPYRFLLQIDFDRADPLDGWGGALEGRLYVFVHPQEKLAVAFWQSSQASLSAG